MTRLGQASGIETPTRASPADPDAKITKMKDGRTHLAHKAEHAVDLDTGAIVAVTIQGADNGDTHTLPETLAEAVEQLDLVSDADGEPVALADEVVADKGCHSRAVVLELNTHGFRTYISEPDRGEQSWTDRRDIPLPSATVTKYRLAMPALVEAKVRLYEALREAKITKSELARRLRVHSPQVDRLFAMTHASKLGQLEAAFRVLGKRLVVRVEDLVAVAKPQSHPREGARRMGGTKRRQQAIARDRDRRRSRRR